MSAALKPSVTPRPVVGQENAGETWVLESHDVVCCDPAHGCVFRIPRGFRTDLASIPQLLRAVVDKGELGLPGPIVHDWVYRHGGVLPTHGLRPTHVYTRADADRLFLQLMEQDGVRWHRRWLAYAAVRAGGGLAWKKGGGQ